MTDRVIAYVVTLERNVRLDDAAVTEAALRQIRGVAEVKPLLSEATVETIAVARRDQEWRRALFNVTSPERVKRQTED